MRFDEMVMVIVNDKGNEKNILTTFEDFTQDFLYPFTGSVEDAVKLIKELNEKQGWAECYKAANKTVSAKYCSGQKELVVFLNRKFNDREDSRFDTSLSSADCLALLLINEKSGSYVVGCDVEYFMRCPKYKGSDGREKFDTDNVEYGIEWGHGVYLSNKPSEIDFVALKKEYGQEPEPDKQGTFEIEVREILSRVERVPAESLGEAIDRVTERYKNGEIVLNADDYKGVDYIPLEEQEKKL